MIERRSTSSNKLIKDHLDNKYRPRLQFDMHEEIENVFYVCLRKICAKQQRCFYEYTMLKYFREEI